MRIVLKPVGASLVVIAFLTLIVLLWHKGSHEAAAEPVTATPPVAAPAPAVRVADSANLLSNPSFEDNYQEIRPYDNKAVLQGKTPSPWRDDSSWAHVNAAYGPDTVLPHSGAHSLKMDVLSVKPGESGLDAVQLVQEVTLSTGQHYSAGVWVRADHPVPVTLTIRQAAEPFVLYGTSTVTVSQKWQRITVDANMTGTGSSYFMVSAAAPATIWVDDASLAAAQP